MPVGLRTPRRIEGILSRSTDHHPDLTELRIRLDLIANFVPGLAGHLVVEKYEVRTELASHLNHSTALFRQEQLYILFVKGYLKCPAHGPTVVCNQDLLTHGSSR